MNDYELSQAATGVVVVVVVAVMVAVVVGGC